MQRFVTSSVVDHKTLPPVPAPFGLGATSAEVILANVKVLVVPVPVQAT